jgi:hypothetical protein
MKRTEAEVLSKAPIKVRLGETDYEIKPLTLGPARLWRQRVLEDMSATLQAFKSTDINPETMTSGFSAAMISFPDKLLKIVMDFAPYLPQAEIEANATDEQLAVAYGKVMTLGFPLWAPLQMTRRAVEAGAY